ncbi:glutamate/gamma-aminobutyrate family transporter YjeM [uncultured Lacticaseibacillus sp.]|uniref:glutamate/gamma-aminobutyrate family transporter YjeM n=1 Tax=uncultured Lacticaseibacillus sp. TaxID=2775882 RepID=UPI002594DB3C|nr:glutamate/gamma-aminobutyrate family transporter YjeM [uncultured Lacticaseibacillus sp.]
MSKTKTVSFIAVMLMIFTSAFAFDNTSIAYYTMGFSGIIWYVLAALLFFVPSSLMFAEYGATLHNDQGGVYSWLKAGLGAKWAFIGGFVWLASWVILIVSTVSKIWIMLATTLTGRDTTNTWSIFGLNSTATIGIMSIIFFLVVTFIATRGLGKVAKLAGIGGLAALALTAVFAIVSLILLAKNGFQFAEPVTAQSMLHSPRSGYQSPAQMLSFIIFAVYAFAGIEALGSVSDRMRNARRNFPRAMVAGAVAITLIYAVLILLWGASSNWQSMFKGTSANLGNTTYVLMSNLGLVFGKAFGLGAAASQGLSFWFARLSAFAMLLSYFGSFFVIVYMPIKSFVLGTPRRLWPGKMAALNANDMPANAMWFQAIVVCVLIALTSFGGRTAEGFYNVLTLMDNISSTVPYLFLVTAFPFFKRRTDLEQPFVIFKRPTTYWLVTAAVDILLLAGVISTVIDSLSSGAYWDLFLEIVGPILFGLIGLTLYKIYTRIATRETATTTDVSRV